MYRKHEKFVLKHSNRLIPRINSFSPLFLPLIIGNPNCNISCPEFLQILDLLLKRKNQTPFMIFSKKVFKIWSDIFVNIQKIYVMMDCQYRLSIMSHFIHDFWWSKACMTYLMSCTTEKGIIVSTEKRWLGETPSPLFHLTCSFIWSLLLWLRQ